MKVCFVYNAQLHQVPHSLPIALEMAARHPGIQVDVAGASPAHLDFARRLAQRYGAPGAVRYRLLDRPWDVRLAAWLTQAIAPLKIRTLIANVAYFSSCDAVVTPERTSLLLRRLGLSRRTRLIYTGHGAGDRAMVVTPEIREFDYVLTVGDKLEKRRLAEGLIRPGAYGTGVYAKFDWVLADTARLPRLFDNDRPTVLYNPHFDPRLSSWPAFGEPVLEHFANSSAYNLVFAPHVRLFDPPTPRKYKAFRRFEGLPHVRIDLGSEQSIDMRYTLGADAYLGDVSSQLAEFMLRPRPCVFLDAHQTAWEGDANYRSWSLGPVVRHVGQLDEALRTAFDARSRYQPLQTAYFDETFGRIDRSEPSSRRGARLIADFLEQGQNRRVRSSFARLPPRAH